LTQTGACAFFGFRRQKNYPELRKEARKSGSRSLCLEDNNGNAKRAVIAISVLLLARDSGNHYDQLFSLRDIYSRARPRLLYSFESQEGISATFLTCFIAMIIYLVILPKRGNTIVWNIGVLWSV
jgi:hypothetical protein